MGSGVGSGGVLVFRVPGLRRSCLSETSSSFVVDLTAVVLAIAPLEHLPISSADGTS